VRRDGVELKFSDDIRQSCTSLSVSISSSRKPAVPKVTVSRSPGLLLHSTVVPNLSAIGCIDSQYFAQRAGSLIFCRLITCVLGLRPILVPIVADCLKS